MKVEMIINLRTAKIVAFSIPPDLTDEVIE
jgi:hypothetical protein